MSPQPTDIPPTNGHPIVPTASIRHSVADRQGKPFIIVDRLAAQRWNFDLQTPQGRPVGHLGIEVSDRIGRIRELFISDESARRFPTWLGRPLGRLGLTWLHPSYRNRGLGSLLLIHGLQVACELHLRGLLATVPADEATVRLFKNLGFSAHECGDSFNVWYRISDH